MNTPLNIIPLVLAGGMGRRLWPLSRETHPKPYLKFWGRPSFLQQTLHRFPNTHAPVIVASQKNLALLQSQIKTMRPAPAQIFLEPVGRGTAAAVAVAAHYFSAMGQDPLLLVMPSDHVIGETQLLRDAIEKGIGFAHRGDFVLFGIRPRHPASGFGYMRPGLEVGNAFQTVEQFVEKPDRATAKNFVQEGWLWNSGIFLMSASAYLKVLEKAAPEIFVSSLAAVSRAQRRQNLILLDQASLMTGPTLSIDRAVMEKADKRVVTALDIGWRDLGTWPSLIRNFIGI